MSKYQSPGVYPTTRDLSTIVPAVGTSTAALVGYSERGSLNVQLITNRQQFIEEYGLPDITKSFFHYTALAFLEKGNSLYCKRVVGDSALYAGLTVVDNTGSAHRALETGRSTITSFYDDQSEDSNSDALFSIYAKDPGSWAEKVSVTITDVKEVALNSNEDYDETDQYTFKINVWYTDSDGNKNNVESWLVSRKRKVDGYGRQLYLEDRINQYSRYIYVADSTLDDTIVPLEYVDGNGDAVDVALGGGADGSAVSASDIETGWDDFENPDNIKVQILLDAGFTAATLDSEVASIQTKIKTIAETRRDCIAILCIPEDIVTNTFKTATEMITYRDTTLNINSSYAALYATYCVINDSYNDRIVRVPPSGYIGGHYALTDAVADVWYAPAGFDRGTLNVLGLTHTFTQGERDQLYSAGINCLQTFRGYGHVIYGQKTLQKKASALDRVNVRRLLLMTEEATVLLLRSFLFELNNELTRFTISATLDEYYSRLSSAGAFQTEAGDSGYLVICDTRNNTPAVLDANELHVDIFLKPARVAEFIKLQTVLTKTGVSFTELISRGAIL